MQTNQAETVRYALYLQLIGLRRDRLTSGISLSLSALIMSCTLYDVSGEVLILPLQVLVMQNFTKFYRRQNYTTNLISAYI